MIHLHAKFRTIPSMQFLRITLCFVVTTGPKLGPYWLKSKYHFWRWSGYTSMPHLGPFHSFSLECSETLISLSFLDTRRPKSGQYRPKSNRFVGDQDTSACDNCGHSFHALCLEWSEPQISSSFLTTKRPNSGQYRLKSNNFWKWSGYVSMPHLGPLLSCILLIPQSHDTPGARTGCSQAVQGLF